MGVGTEWRVDWERGGGGCGEGRGGDSDDAKGPLHRRLRRGVPTPAPPPCLALPRLLPPSPAPACRLVSPSRCAVGLIATTFSGVTPTG